jgi:hypothetical protein
MDEPTSTPNQKLLPSEENQQGTKGGLDVKASQQIDKSFVTILKNLLSSDAILLFLLPIIGYSIYYSYWKGFFSFFNIPQQFISYDTGQILGLIFVYFPLLFVLYVIYLMSIKINPLNETIPILKIFEIIIIILLIAFSFALIFFNDFLLAGLIFLAGAFSICLLSLSLPIYRLFLNLRHQYLLYKSKSRLNKAPISIQMNTSQVSEEKKKPKNSFTVFYNNVLNKLEVKLLMVIFFFLIFNNFLSIIGSLDAINKKTFYVFQNTPECVVLYMSSDKAICAEFNRTTKEAINSFKIIPLGKDTSANISYEEIGPLRIKK